MYRDLDCGGFQAKAGQPGFREATFVSHLLGTQFCAEYQETDVNSRYGSVLVTVKEKGIGSIFMS